ncbi:MAG: ribosome assembly factor SBDS [Methermicoccaceae archaeon]
MVSLEEAVVARLKSHGKHFEVLVDPEIAFSLRRGEDADLDKLLAVEEVFADASRGERPAEDALLSAFGTENIIEIAQKIVMDGEVQLTAQQRKILTEEKRRRVIDIIAQNAINPQTHTPHPPTRIERAMEEAGVHIDHTKSVDEVVKITMKAIRPIIPIRFETIQIAVKFPPEYAGKAYGEVKKFGDIVQDEWLKDGSWAVVIKLPAGIQDSFYNAVNAISKGSAETRFLK